MTLSFSSTSPLPIENVLNNENNVWFPLFYYKNFVCYSKQGGALEISNVAIGAKLVTGCFETIEKIS